MVLGVLAESNDQRVAITPEHIQLLTGMGIQKVLIETNAGKQASYSDEQYVEKGGELHDRSAIIEKADVLVCIQPLTQQEL